MLKISRKFFSSQNLNYPKRVMIACVEGNEEIETVTISNILTRAGNEVKICKVNIEEGTNQINKEITLARGIRIVKIFQDKNIDC